MDSTFGDKLNVAFFRRAIFCCQISHNSYFIFIIVF